MTSILPIGTLLLQEASRSRPDTGEEWGFLFYFSIALALTVIVAFAILGYARWKDRRQERVEEPTSSVKPTQKSRGRKKSASPTTRPKKEKSREDEKVQGETVSPAIFISYRREDSSDVTGRIYDRLAQHFGKQSVFKDVDSIPLGVDFKKHLGDSVGKCNVMIAVIGRQWASGEEGERLNDERDFVRVEIEAALQRDIPVVPVLVQGAQIPREEMLPASLRSLSYRNGLSVRPDPDFHQDMDRLIKGIEGHLK